MHIQTCCDHLSNLYIFDQKALYRVEVRLERMPASSLVLLPSHPPTSPPSQEQALTTLPPRAKFQLVRRRLCEPLLPSSSLAGQKHPSLLSRMSEMS